MRANWKKPRNALSLRFTLRAPTPSSMSCIIHRRTVLSVACCNFSTPNVARKDRNCSRSRRYAATVCGL
jgi:hypothetical protein